MRSGDKMHMQHKQHWEYVIHHNKSYALSFLWNTLYVNVNSFQSNTLFSPEHHTAQNGVLIMILSNYRCYTVQFKKVETGNIEQWFTNASLLAPSFKKKANRRLLDVLSPKHCL